MRRGERPHLASGVGCVRGRLLRNRDLVVQLTPEFSCGAPCRAPVREPSIVRSHHGDNLMPHAPAAATPRLGAPGPLGRAARWLARMAALEPWPVDERRPAALENLVRPRGADHGPLRSGRRPPRWRERATLLGGDVDDVDERVPLHAHGVAPRQRGGRREARCEREGKGRAAPHRQHASLRADERCVCPSARIAPAAPTRAPARRRPGCGRCRCARDTASAC